MTTDDQELVSKAREYLRLCEERCLEEAGRYLAPNVQLKFPGNANYGHLESMAANAKGRYREVHKTYDMTTVGKRLSDGRSVVCLMGELNGIDRDGKSFSGVRYSDTFVFDERGRIAEQIVLNDLAELGIVRSHHA